MFLRARNGGGFWDCGLILVFLLRHGTFGERRDGVVIFGEAARRRKCF